MEEKKWIGPEQHRQIEALYPASFYAPHFFVRLGLFLFTTFLTLCAMGLASFVFFSEGFRMDSAGVVFILYGVGTGMALEYFIGSKHHYRSGIDDALLYFTLILIITDLSVLSYSSFEDEPLGYCLLAFPVLLAGSIRYADRLVAVLTTVCLLVIVVLLYLRFTWGRMLLPFVLITTSALVYYFIKRQQMMAARRYWAKCFRVIEGLVLLTFYLSGNYYAVQEGNVALIETSNGNTPIHKSKLWRHNARIWRRKSTGYRKKVKSFEVMSIVCLRLKKKQASRPTNKGFVSTSIK